MDNIEQAFSQLASDAQVPIDEQSVKQEFDRVREQENIVITNQSSIGPFWRFIDGVAVKAALWLLTFLFKNVMPQAFVKKATGVFLELHGRAVDLERKEAVTAIGLVAFTRLETSNELTIPIGAVIRSGVVNGSVYQLVTTQVGQFDIGQSTVLVEVEAVEVGGAFNLPAGTYNTFGSDIYDVTVTNLEDWLIRPGADREEDEDFRARIINQFSAVNQWHTDAVYTSIIASFEGVKTSNIFFQHDAPRGPGTANAFIFFDIGNPSEEFIATIQSEITDNGNHGHGDDLQVMAMPEDFYSLECRIRINSFNTVSAIERVEQIIRAAFRENIEYSVTTVAPFSRFSFSKLTFEIHNLVEELDSITFNVEAIESELSIPRLQELNIVVEQ